MGLAALAALSLPAEEFPGLDDRVDDLMRQFEERGVPGASVGVFSEGEIILQRSAGLADPAAGTPANEQTNYRLASITKQFTAMAIMIMQERGLLSYDDPLTTFFPDFPADIGERITVRHVLTHTSGLVAYEDLYSPDRTEQLHDEDVLDLLLMQHGTYFTPGTEYRYSNTGYSLLALIVERISGQSFPEFLRANIFDPLGMEGTVALREGVNTVPNRAIGHAISDEEVVPRDQSMTSAVLGDGGIYCSVADYFRWDLALHGDDLVTRATIEEAFTPHTLASGEATGYGFGWRIDTREDGVRVIHHSGSTCGFHNGARRVPERELAVIILTNMAGSGAADAAEELMDWLLSQP